MIVGMVLAAALAPVWAAERAAGSDSPAPDGVVSFTLAADKTVFVAKDPLEFKVTVKNVSRQTYTFTTGRAHYYWKYHIKAADRDAEYEVFPAMLFEAEPAPFSARLAPGETAVQPIKLGNLLCFRLLKGAPSDTGKRNESLESARLPAGRYAMTVEFDYRLVSEETVAGKATLGPVAFTIAGEPEAKAQVDKPATAFFIIPHDQQAILETGAWTPSPEQAKKAMDAIQRHLKGEQPSKSDQRAFAVRDAEKKIVEKGGKFYRVQFIGEDINGQRLIRCQCFPKREDDPNWKTKEYQYGKDGGVSYWGIRYDPDKNECLDFWTHGEG